MGIKNEISEDRPIDSCVEINLFGGGNGIGECLVIHLSNNKWIVVDSFLDPISKNPIALEYLTRIGVNLEAVRYVIASHWHDDHVQGISKVYENCENAKFILSSALKLNQLTKLIQLNNYKGALNSGVDEFSNVVEFAIVNNKKNKRVSEGHILPIEDEKEISITVLSPTEGSLEFFEREFAELLNIAYDFNLKIPNINPNHSCVVIQIKVGNHFILLGGDLEVTSNRNMGWYAIIDGEYVFKNNYYGVFKIPHHGSENGHCIEQWNDLLKENCNAILTTYSKGRKKLPSENDINRIKSLTDFAFTTSSNNQIYKKKRSKAVEKFLNEFKFDVKSKNFGVGQIRLRSVNDNAWEIDTFGTALKIV